MEKTRDPASQSAAIAGHRSLREEIKKKQKLLDTVKDDKFKPAESKRSKNN